jgi:outer membrane receptor protein involved in Fe transport
VGSYSVSENTQIRAGFTRSLSYPATVEVADTNFVDTQTDESFIGNPELRLTTIDSADLRFEWYPSRGEALTVGGFYKDFTDPIERSFIALAGGSKLISFDNADKGKVYGLELNTYFGLDTLLGYLQQDYESDWISNINVGLNFAIQDSEVKQDSATTSATNPLRRMTGQPDSTANFQIGYIGPEHIFTLKFGRVGKRLITAGVENLPDEFLSQRYDLGFKWSWSPTAWPILEPMTISLEIENLLDDEYERTQGDFVIRTYKTGITGKLGLKYRFDSF